MKRKIKIIKKLNNLEEKYDGSWMSDNAHTAFLVSIGAGPWKEKRRYNVQKAALDWFYSKKVTDFKYLSGKRDSVYPFSWQNNFLFNMVDSLHEFNDLFEAECLRWKVTPDWKSSVEELFERCGTSKKGAKVLWMFARDYLNIPAFPIDRHVKRTLEQHKLPVCPYKMVDLCLQAEVSPNILNRKMFAGVNPDWSKY